MNQIILPDSMKPLAQEMFGTSIFGPSPSFLPIPTEAFELLKCMPCKACEGQADAYGLFLPPDPGIWLGYYAILYPLCINCTEYLISSRVAESVLEGELFFYKSAGENEPFMGFKRGF